MGLGVVALAPSGTGELQHWEPLHHSFKAWPQPKNSWVLSHGLVKFHISFPLLKIRAKVASYPSSRAAQWLGLSLGLLVQRSQIVEVFASVCSDFCSVPGNGVG